MYNIIAQPEIIMSNLIARCCSILLFFYLSVVVSCDAFVFSVFRIVSTAVNIKDTYLSWAYWQEICASLLPNVGLFKSQTLELSDYVDDEESLAVEVLNYRDHHGYFACELLSLKICSVLLMHPKQHENGLFCVVKYLRLKNLLIMLQSHCFLYLCNKIIFNTIVR